VNYFSKIGAAEIKLEGHGVKAGDMILFTGNKTGVFEQTVESMEIEHKKVKAAKKKQSIALMTTNMVRKNDKMFVLTSA